MAGSVFVVGKVMFWGFVLGPGFRIVSCFAVFFL